MDPAAIAAELARGGRLQELTSAPFRGVSPNRVFRLWGENSNQIIKIYGSAARERRERHALEALRGLSGIPTVLQRGTKEACHWAIFDDGGQWNLASLPENSGLARQAGAILRALHGSDPAAFSNLPRGIDQEWVAIDFTSTFRRIERYRGRLGISVDLIEAARAIRPPFASTPRVANTNPVPEHFLVDHRGNVTLIDWEWATLAPPEWDLSRALWLVGLRSGLATAQAMAEGYGVLFDAEQLDRWTVYHAGMMLVYETENRIDMRPDDLSYLVAELQRAVTAARGAT